MRYHRPMKSRGGEYSEIVHHPDDVMTCRNPRDRSSQHIVEHQSRDAELREGTPQCLLYDAVDAASGKHRTALDIHRSNRVGEDDDPENKPRSGFTHRLFRKSSSVES